MIKRIFLLVLIFVNSAIFSNEPVVLVTGGAGYIGSHTCKVLKEAGYLPVAYDSLLYGSKELVRWGPLFEGDLRDKDQLDAVFSKYHPIAVIHCAGLRNIGESISDPFSCYDMNVVGSLNLLNAMKKHQVKKIIFSSSSTVYGETEAAAHLTETLSENPTNPYSNSKAMTERFIRDFSKAYDFEYMVLRYFNAAGVDYSSGLKRLDCSMCFLIPATLLVAKNADKILSVFGSDYPTPDGTAIRDYIHVRDLAQAHRLALEHLLDNRESCILNIGTGFGSSILDVIKMTEEVTGKKIPIQMMPRKEGDLPITIADPSLSQKVLNFTPQYSDLKTIIESEWKSILLSH
ncbi:MAG: UDP-glucose 4-epimerase [Chlamydiae bacterium]|nr:UDP-glucose 4-epimerase [Chlamydiota bacterium]